jgi:hypothetical protein
VHRQVLAAGDGSSLRHCVDDGVVCKLAGVERYDASEVWRKQPLVDVYGAHPELEAAQ